MNRIYVCLVNVGVCLPGVQQIGERDRRENVVFEKPKGN